MFTTMTEKHFCARCQQELTEDSVRESPVKRTKRSWLTYERALPVLLLILIAMSIVQAVELRSVSGGIQERLKTTAAAQASSSPQAASSAPSPLQGLPAQVGGC